MLTWRYRCLIKSSISKRTVFFFLVCEVNILHGMLCFPYSDHLMFSGPVYMRWASPVSRASPLNRDGSAFRCVYMIGVVWWWHLFARKYAISKLLLTEMILSISIFRLAPDHVSTHNNLGTLLENNEVWPRNFKILFLLKDKTLNPRPDSNPEPRWVGLSILQATERLVGSRARPFIEFFLETFLHTVTTISVESGSLCRYRGKDYVQQKNQKNQTIKPPGELYCFFPLFLLWWRYLQKYLTVATILSRFLNILSSKISFGTPPSTEEGPHHCPPLGMREAMRRGCIRWL